MEQHVLDLVRGMAGLEHEVFVWCNEGPVVSLYEQAGAKVTTKNITLDVDPAYIFSLSRFLHDNKIDIVHAHELKAVTNALIAARIAGTPVKISHTHTPISEWQVSSLKKTPTVFVYSQVVNMFSDCEIALTESRRNVKIAEGIKEHKLKVIPNGIDLNRFSPIQAKKQEYRTDILEKYGIPKDAFIFGNISRLTEEKGHDVLIKAFAKLKEFKETKDEKLHLLIGGGGRLEEELRQLAEAEGVSDNITITGRFSEEEQIRLYSAFDVFVFPSRAEGFGIVLTEAMAAGLPLIASNLQVLEEVGGSAVFSYFETGDAENLAQKMLNSYIKRGSLDNIVNAARERVETNYSMEKFVDRYKELYEDLNAGKN